MSERAEWTVMIYMAGDNNLSEDLIMSLKDIQAMNHDDRVQVVAQYDSGAMGISTQRYIFRKGKTASIFESWSDDDERKKSKNRRIHFKKGMSKRKPPLSETNTGSLWTLYDFMLWAFKKCPANNYMLVISGHSSGIENGFLATDLSSADALSIPELEYALYLALNPSPHSDATKKRKLAILGFDSCLMSSAEVAYEMRKHADYLVGSEGYMARAGWCYRKILNKLIEMSKNSAVAPKDFAARIVEINSVHYLDYTAAGMSIDFAACDLNRCQELKKSVNYLAEVLLKKLKINEDGLCNEPVKNAVFLAHWEAQTYKNDLYVDLYDFCLMLEKYFPADQKIKDASAELKGVLLDSKDSFVVKSCYIGAIFQHSYGLSICFPWSKLLPEYIGRQIGDYFKLQLDFLREPDSSSKYEPTNWRVFVEKFIEITRRKARGNSVTETLLIPKSMNKLSEWQSAHREDPLHGRHDPLHGNPKGPGFAFGSMKNPPENWNLSECLLEAATNTDNSGG